MVLNLDGLTLDVDDLAAPVIGTFDTLKRRITVLSERLWEDRVTWPLVEDWLDNFDGRTGSSVEVEQLHAIYLLSQFLYFGSNEIRVLLTAIYRDQVLIPSIQEVRSELAGSREVGRVMAGLQDRLSRTRFLGIGNPSESGVHLLYFFRQENSLSKRSFIDSSELVSRTVDADGLAVGSIRDPQITDYVWIDDVCGSGETAERYSGRVLNEMSRLPGGDALRFHYYAIFATAEGMERVRRHTLFGQRCGAVFELDDSYRSLAPNSRYLNVGALPLDIDPAVVRAVALTYGETLYPGAAGGFGDCQLLLGLHHNTPDNTLPIMWMSREHGAPSNWIPAFKRYAKLGYY